MKQMVALALLALAGCAGAPEAAPPAGKAAPSAAADPRAKALKRASDYCSEKGLVMQPARNADTPTRPGQLAAEVQFRCVKPAK
ncbi:MAG: hypothetical protein K8R60_24615 [Burkholderiales bacterium]|nr:hypothetical protein [Burkholderiales bacterium]